MGDKIPQCYIRIKNHINLLEKLDFKIKCPECDGDFQRLICFRDGMVLKPPSVKMEFTDNHEGWKYWLDHVR